MRYIASCSGGKDSIAMVLELIRRQYPLDAVITVDLGAEFQSIYTALGQISAICAIEGIPFRTLRPEHDFMWYFAEKPVRTAYCLDGGQTGEVVFRGEPYNYIDFGVERTVSDILWFATNGPAASK
jgi:hypothetical protein